MRKLRLVITILLSFCCISVFSAGISEEQVEVWFAPYPAGFNINLLDPEKKYTGPSQEFLNGGALTSADKESLVAVVGFGGIHGDSPLDDWWTSLWTGIGAVNVNITFDSMGKNDWNYISASEPFLSRPFDVTVVTSYSDFEKELSGTAGANIIRVSKKMGFSQTDHTTSYPIEVDEETINASDDKVVWIGVFLDLSSASSPEYMINALSANDYYCRMNISLDVYSERGSNVLNKDWAYIFNGYISDEIQNNVSHVFFTITPNASANSISVSDLEKKGIVEIGAYSYESQSFLYDVEAESGNSDDPYSYQNQVSNDYYIFASSSPLATDTAAEEFKLVNSGIESNPSEDNIIYYEIGLKSDLTGNEYWYDGTSSNYYMKGTRREEMFGAEYVQTGSGILGIPIYGVKEHNTIVFEDSGTISIRAAQIKYSFDDLNAENYFSADKFRSGAYTSTVYLHVVSTK